MLYCLCIERTGLVQEFNLVHFINNFRRAVLYGKVHLDPGVGGLLQTPTRDTGAESGTSTRPSLDYH